MVISRKGNIRNRPTIKEETADIAKEGFPGPFKKQASSGASHKVEMYFQRTFGRGENPFIVAYSYKPPGSKITTSFIPFANFDQAKIMFKRVRKQIEDITR